MKKLLVLGFILVLLQCQRHYTSYMMTRVQAEQVTDEESRYLRYKRGSRSMPMNYLDSLVSIRTLNVAIHFMNSLDSSYNYLGQEAIRYAKSLIQAVNGDLAVNQKMNLPLGNDTEVLPTNYRLQLLEGPQGVQFHYDDELYYFIKQGKYRNNYSRTAIKKYAHKPDSIINLFIMSHHPDSIASKTYRADGSGVSLGTSIKVAGLFENGGPAGNYRGLVNHEVGHVLGLRHAWGFDPCEDTPAHSNCWANTGIPPCDGPVSNNLMDYNPSQNAITPCQLTIIHRNLGRYQSKIRKLVSPTWCELDETKNITINDSVVWDFEIDVEGNIVILENGILEIKSRVSIPEHGKITVYPGAKLILNEGVLHNSCNRMWQGIELLELKKEKGVVDIIGDARIENTYSRLN